MALALRTTFRAGVGRVCTRNGAVLIGVFLLLSALQAGFVWVVSTTYVPLGSSTQVVTSPSANPSLGTALPSVIALPAILLSSVTGGVLTVPVQIVAIRTMVSRRTDRIPDKFIFHNMGRATVHSVLGSWVVSVLVLLTTLCCLLPGLLLLFAVTDHSTLSWLIGSWTGRIGLCLFGLGLLVPSALLCMNLIFVGHEIATKDKGVKRAVTGSWRRCRGHRLRLLSLVSVLIGIQLGASIPVFVYLDSLLSHGVIFIETAIIRITTVAVMARAYVAVHENDTTRGGLAGADDGSSSPSLESAKS